MKVLLLANGGISINGVCLTKTEAEAVHRFVQDGGVSTRSLVELQLRSHWAASRDANIAPIGQE